MRALAIGLLLAAGLSAADPQVVVVEESGGAFVVPVTETQYQEVQKQVSGQVNGRVEIQTVTEKVPVTVMRLIAIDAKAGEFLDRAGRPIDPKAVAELLKKGTVLVLSPDGSAVGPEPLKKNEKIEAILLLKPGKKEAGPPPKLGTLERGLDGHLHVEVTMTHTVPVQEVRTRTVGGRTVAETVTVRAPQTYKMRHALAAVRITDLGGNPVDPKTLRPGSRVAVAADFKPVDPAHVQELKGVVAVVVPREVLP